MDFQSVLVEIAEAFVAENYRSQLPQGILLNQASISGALPPPPSAGSSVATLHELTSAGAEQRQEALSSASDVGGDADQASSGSARRSPSEGANSASVSTGGAGGTSVGTNHGGASGGDFRNASAKQIGVSIQSLAAAENSGYLATMLHGLLQERPATGGEGNAIAVQNSKSIPVHCLVEQGCGQATEPTVNNDCYAIIPSCTLFSDLVRTALINLGYSANEVIGARGAIQIKNWRPLTFDQITENSEATVGDILGELATIAMLRIRLYSRPKPNAASDVKEKLLQVLLAQSQSVLMSTGCPIDQTMLAALTKGRIECDISEDTRKKFDQWYLQQVFQHCRQVVLQQHHHQQQQQVAQQLQQQLQKQHTKPPISNQQPEVTYSTTSPPRLVSAPPLSQHRTRIRTSFDPELELPKLHQWFSENQHPSRVQIQQYVKDLNSLESRRGRKPLDINNVVYWFKNARAAHKRAEQRFCSDGSTTNGLRSPYSELAGESHSHMERFETGNGGLIGHHRLVMGSPYHVDDDHLVGHHAESSTGYDPLDSGDDNLEEDDYVHTLDLSVKKQKLEEEVPREDEENNDKRPNPSTPVNNISLDNLNKISLDNSDKILVKREPHYSSSEQSMEDSSGESGDEDILMDHREDGNSSNDATPLLTGAGLRRESMESQAASETGNPNGNGQLSPTSSVILTPSTPTTTAVAATQGNGENGIGVCAPVQVNCLEERRKRNRTFIDPVTEVPRLEYWFESNTHPSHSQIVRFTHELNCMPYRSKFPKLEPKNIQFWFKNRRAKCKRLHLANFPHNGVERLVQNAIRDTENAAALHGLSAVIRDSAGNANSSIRGISAAM